MPGSGGHAARRDSRRRSARPARRRARAARTAAGRCPRRAFARSSRSWARRWPAGQVVLVPGNHDHRLAEPLLERQAIDEQPLGLEQVAEPAGEAARQDRPLARTAPSCSIAYPGDLAARRRLRHARALHGLPLAAAAHRVRGGGERDARLRPAPGGRPAGRLRAGAASRLRPLLLPRPVRAGAAGDQALRARLAHRWRPATAPTAAFGERRCGQPSPPASRRRYGASTARCGPSSRSTSPPPRSRAAASPPRPSWSRRLGVEAGHVITGHTHRGGPADEEVGVGAAGGRPPPQHRQLGLRLGLPPPGHASRPLLAGNRHLAGGRAGRRVTSACCSTTAATSCGRSRAALPSTPSLFVSSP